MLCQHDDFGVGAEKERKRKGDRLLIRLAYRCKVDMIVETDAIWTRPT